MYCRRSVIVVFLLGVSVCGCMTATEADPGHAFAEAPTAGFLFDQYEVVTSSATRQTVVTGHFLGCATADLAILYTDAGKDGRLQIYSFDGGSWVRRLVAPLRSEVRFVDVAKISGRDRLITYEPGRLNWFDPGSASVHPLVTATSNFSPPRKDEIPHVDVTRDLNGDGRDDLVVPEVDGFRVFTQLDSGSFADPVKVGSDTDMSRIYGADGYRYDPWSQSRIHEMDYDQDGRNDLVFWEEDHFDVHLQDEDGLFARTAQSFSTDVLFDSDDLSSLAIGEMKGRVLYALTDLNHDGIGDMVIHALEGNRVSDKYSAYEVHFGERVPDGGTVFASDVGLAFQSEGSVLLGMDRYDFDGDGRLDVMLTTIDVEFLQGSLWKRIKGVMGDDVWLELEFYQAQDGHYPKQPNLKRRVALDGVPSHTEPGWVPLDIVLRGATHEERRTQESWPRAFNMVVRIGDVNGDGRSDLLIGKNTPNGVDIFVGVPGSELFSGRHQDLAAVAPGGEDGSWLVAAPNDEEYTWLVDLNEDGKQDIVMHHPFTLRDAHGARKLPPGSEPHRVTVLIAR